MELDLLFTAVKQSEWGNVSGEGSIKPDSVSENGYVKTFVGAEAEKIINHYFSDTDKVLLVVLDPLRIQSPIKHIKEDGFEFVAVQGSISVDAIIDKIKLESDKNGKFSVNVKHFD